MEVRAEEAGQESRKGKARRNEPDAKQQGGRRAQSLATRMGLQVSMRMFPLSNIGGQVSPVPLGTDFARQLRRVEGFMGSRMRNPCSAPWKAPPAPPLLPPLPRRTCALRSREAMRPGKALGVQGGRMGRKS